MREGTDWRRGRDGGRVRRGGECEIHGVYMYMTY